LPPGPADPGCGWFESSHALRTGLTVLEIDAPYEPADGLTDGLMDYAPDTGSLQAVHATRA
jgi:hypothetical protein